MSDFEVLDKEDIKFARVTNLSEEEVLSRFGGYGKYLMLTRERERCKKLGFSVDSLPVKLTDDDVGSILFVNPFQARGQIHIVPHDGVVEPVPRAHIPHTHLTGVDAHANGHGRQCPGFPFHVELFQAQDHINRRFTGTNSMIGLLDRGPIKGHNRIPHVFIHGASQSLPSGSDICI